MIPEAIGQRTPRIRGVGSPAHCQFLLQ